MADLFALASRAKLRFDTKQGPLSAEDLWDLPLTSTRTNIATLDEIAVGLDRQLKEAGTTSFVKKTTKSNDALKLRFDIVLQVIEVRQAEDEAAETQRSNAEKKQQILALIAQKENEALAGESIDKLRELAASL